MIHIVRSNQRNLQPLELEGATVSVSDPIVGARRNLSAGFTEYSAPSRLRWTFDYDEVFLLLEGGLEIHAGSRPPVVFAAGDLGYIKKGEQTTIVVPQRAYLLHFTQPAWRE